MKEFWLDSKIKRIRHQVRQEALDEAKKVFQREEEARYAEMLRGNEDEDDLPGMINEVVVTDYSWAQFEYAEAFFEVTNYGSQFGGLYYINLKCSNRGPSTLKNSLMTRPWRVWNEKRKNYRAQYYFQCPLHPQEVRRPRRIPLVVNQPTTSRPVIRFAEKGFLHSCKPYDLTKNQGCTCYSAARTTIDEGPSSFVYH